MANQDISQNKITKQQIEKIYHGEKLTARELAKRLNISYGQIAWLLRKYSILPNRPNKFQKGVKQYFHAKGEDHPGWKGGKFIEQICIDCGNKFPQYPSTHYIRCKKCRGNKKIKPSIRLDIANHKFGKLIAIKRNGYDKNGHNLWLCKCECGNEKSIPTAHLTSNSVKSCGCSQGLKGEFNSQWKGGWKNIPRNILSLKMSSAVRRTLKRTKNKKNWKHWEDITGYSLIQLEKRLRKTMPQRYCWKDFLTGKLHIDHIIPVSAYNFRSYNDLEFKECWGLKNLQLLPAKENYAKRDKLIQSFQPNLPLAVNS